MAANSILKLKVDNTEYDANIKKAAEGIQHLAKRMHDAQGDFEGLDKASLDFIKDLQYMTTSAKTASGQYRELENAYKNLAATYEGLNAFEKEGDAGKALAEQLEILKKRTLDMKANMDAASQSLQTNATAGQEDSSALSKLAERFTINIDALKLFNIGMQAAEGVLSIAKDAFFSSESNIDEWGRTVEGAKGAYDVFLQTINGGNWSDFFTNLSTAVQGARDLYDALDSLGSVKSNNQAAIAIQQQQVAQLRLMKQQGQNVDEQLKVATERLAQLQQQSVDAGKGAGHKMILETLQNRVNGANKTGVNISDGTLRGVAGALENRGQDYVDQMIRKYNILNEKGMEDVEKYDALTRTYYKDRVFNLEKLTKAEQQQYLLAYAVKEGETEIQKGISIYAQAVNEGAAAAREQFKGNRYALQGAGGSKTNPADQAADKFAQAQKDYQQALELAATQLKAGTSSDVEYEKKKLAAEESLWKAIGDAREKYDNPKYKEAQDQAAARILELGGSVKALTEQQEAAKKALQQAEAAYKKEADAADKMADYVFAASKAVDNNDLKGFYAANKGLSGMGAGTMDVPVNFTYTDTNLQAFIGKLKEDIGSSDVGSDLYNELTEQLNDATALGNLFQTAIANGVDAAQLGELGNAIFQKIFSGENIDSEIFKSFAQLLSDSTGKNISVDDNGKVTEKEDKIFQDFTKGLQSVTSGLSSVTTGLKSLGVEIPAELDSLMTTINAVGQIISGVQSLVSLTQVPSQTANTTAVGLNTAAIGALIAALEINTATNIIPFAGGGIVGRAANGLLVGNNMSGDNLRMPVLGGSGGMIGVNDGELILNRVQQGVLASELEGGGLQNLNLEARIEAEDIVLTMNNNSERWGGGEYVTSK